MLRFTLQLFGSKQCYYYTSLMVLAYLISINNKPSELGTVVNVSNIPKHYALQTVLLSVLP